MISKISNEKYKLQCNCCDEYIIFSDFMSAVKHKKDEGWRSFQINGEWKEVCPDCIGSKYVFFEDDTEDDTDKIVSRAVGNINSIGDEIATLEHLVENSEEKTFTDNQLNTLLALKFANYDFMCQWHSFINKENKNK